MFINRKILSNKQLISEDKIENFLVTLGIKPTASLVLEAQNFLNTNTQMTIDKLYDFLKFKKIISLNDQRKLTAEKEDPINFVSISVGDFQSFKTKMENLGYEFVSETFFIKKFNNDIELNITYREKQIKSITCYQQDELIEISDELQQQAMNDINQCI